MLVAIPDILTQEEVAHCRRRLEEAQWIDGKETAGGQAAQAKMNLQIQPDSGIGRELGDIVLRGLGRNPTFVSAALPHRILPPMFNRYDVGMTFKAHVDNSIRALPGGGRMRTDVSSTLFLTDPEDYEGGELVVQDTYGVQQVKLPAGHMVVYPATSLHSVNPVTRGSRWASFFWTQSMIRDDGRRALLYEMDMGIIALRQSLGDDHAGILAMTATYHNLLRQWAEM